MVPVSVNQFRVFFHHFFIHWSAPGAPKARITVPQESSLQASSMAFLRGKHRLKSVNHQLTRCRGDIAAFTRTLVRAPCPATMVRNGAGDGRGKDLVFAWKTPGRV